MATEVKQRNNRVIVLVGVVIALVAFGLSLYVSHNGSGTTASSGQTVPVAVAKTDLLQGSQITSDAISIVQYNTSQVPVGASPDGATLINKFLSVGVTKNTPLTANLLVADANSAKTAALTVQPLDIHPGYVAIAIPTDGGGSSDKPSPDIVSVGGWIQPEDHIDFIIDTGQGTVRYAFQDVRVLKVGTQSTAGAGGAGSSATVLVLELPRAQAEQMAFLIAKKTDLQGQANGPHIISMVLRGIKDKGTGSGSNYLDDASPNVPAKADAPVSVNTFNALFPGK